MLLFAAVLQLTALVNARRRPVLPVYGARVQEE